MSRTLIALFEDYDAAMAECKRLLGDGPAQMGRWLTEQLLNVLLDDEMDQRCRATWHERTPERRDWRNGAYGRMRRTFGPRAPRWGRSRSGCRVRARAALARSLCRASSKWPPSSSRASASSTSRG